MESLWECTLLISSLAIAMNRNFPCIYCISHLDINLSTYGGSGVYVNVSDYGHFFFSHLPSFTYFFIFHFSSFPFIFLLPISIFGSVFFFIFFLSFSILSLHKDIQFLEISQFTGYKILGIRLVWQIFIPSILTL